MRMSPRLRPGPPPAPRPAPEPAGLTPLRRLTPFGFWLTAVLVSIVVGVVGAGIAVLIVRTEPARYQSTATLAIDQPYVLSQTTDPGEVAKLIELRYKYADFATTLAFAGDASQGTNISVATLHSSIVTSVPANSLLFDVGGQAGQPGLARAIAGNAAHALVRYVTSEQDSLGIKSKQKVLVRIVTSPQPAVQIAPSTNRQIGAGGFVGGVLFVLALSLQALRRRYG